MDLKMKALIAIEGLTFPDVAMSDEEKLTDIYKFSHIAVGRCSNKHEDWHIELDNCIKFLEKAGITNPWQNMKKLGRMKHG